MRRSGDPQIVLLADSAVGFDAGREILAAQRASIRRRRERERTADADRIAELPRIACEIFLPDQICRGVPAVVIARENELRLDLPLVFQPRLAVRRSDVVARIEADDLAQRLVGAV